MFDTPAFAGSTTARVTVPVLHDDEDGKPASAGLTEIEHVAPLAITAESVTEPPRTFVGPDDAENEEMVGAGTASTVTVADPFAVPETFVALSATV